jgi:hypothetical protein
MQNRDIPLRRSVGVFVKTTVNLPSIEECGSPSAPGKGFKAGFYLSRTATGLFSWLGSDQRLAGAALVQVCD